jgi:hypothetical protein
VDDIDHAFTVGSYCNLRREVCLQQIEAHDLLVREGRGKRIVGLFYVVTVDHK